MTLGGLATPFLVPPVNLAVLSALCLLAGWRRLAGLALVALLVLALPPVAGALTATLEQGEQAGDPAGAQAIILLGAEVVHQADGHTAPGLLSLERERTAARLARQTGLPLLVSGGVTRPGAAPVGAAMAESLREDFATPARWVEDRSADTFENAGNAARILLPEGIKTVLVVTDQWHMRRARLAFRIAGLQAIAAPVPPSQGGVDWHDFIPYAGAWMESYYALHEWIGIAWYMLRAYQ